MKKKDDPLYIALYLIDVNFNWRWLNHAFLIDEILKKNSYSKNIDIAYLMKRELTRKVIKIGFPTWDLSDEEIEEHFLKHYKIEDHYISGIFSHIKDYFKNEFILNKDQILLLIDIMFLIPNHIVSESYKGILDIKKQIPHGQQEIIKYKSMAFIKKTCEVLGNKFYSTAYNFMEINKSTWDKWKGSYVAGILNKDRFDKWMNETPNFLIEEIKPELLKFFIDPSHTYTKMDVKVKQWLEIDPSKKGIG
jgi:hypothetical protein